MSSPSISSPISDLSPRSAALWAGAGLLLMAVLAPIAYFGILHSIIIPGDAAATAKNLLSQGTAYRWALSLLLVTSMLDIVVGWALFVLFRASNPSLALLMALFRVVYAVAFAVALNSLFGALAAATSSPDQALALTRAFQSGWDLSLALFGVHLVLLAGLLWQRIKSVAALVLLAGLGYLFDSFGKLLWPDFPVTLASYTFLGEVILIVWLFWKGGRTAKER